VTSNKTAGDPIIKYRVDTDPETSVDLLWGVNADENGWASIQDQEDVQNVAGLPFINLNKPKTPFDADGGKIKFNLRHALAKVRVTIDYIADDNTPAPGDNYKPTEAPNLINADQTRIFVRWIKMNGFALEGALNLNNDEPNTPNWKAFDGIRELNFDDITFNDGRKDNKEGIKNGVAKNELNIGLNEEIVENFAELEDGKFSSKKNPGVKPFVKDNYATAQLLFGGDPEANGGYFYVIPRGQGESVNIEIDYDVLTLDSCLSTTLSGTKDFGSQVENQIAKNDIFGNGIDFEAGKQYDIHIHLGMTSVKIEAVVEDWKEAENGTPDVDLPDNQPDAVTPTPTPTPTPAPATVAEALAATPAITSFKYTLVGHTDADLIGTMTTETFEYRSTSFPSRSGTYYKFNRANGTNYVWVKADAKIDGTTETRVLAQNGTISQWSIKLAPAD
jgi:hypothetical protein